MKILYITYIDFGKFSSGSSVRPQKMHQAFLDAGHEIKLLEGQQNKLRERRRRVKEMIRWLDHNTPDICYIESPTGPIFNGIDLRLIKKVHGKNIPMAIFYRDAYWKFAEWWQVRGLKRWVLIMMHQWDLRVFRKCLDIMYFPSKSMADLFDFPHREALPPAMEWHGERESKTTNTAIYVGGFDDVFGTTAMVEAFERLNKGGFTVRMILVTRRESEGKIPSYDWLDVHYASGDDQLAPLYAQADVCLLPRKRNIYMDFSVPVKLFEYLGYGLPVIAVNCTETERVIKEYGCGLVCDNDPDAFTRVVKEFYTSPDIQKQCREGVIRALTENQWIDRACKVVDQLSVLRKIDRGETK